MAAPKGTLERLAWELGYSLEPLADLLAEGEIQALFAELGLAPPDELLDNAAFTTALSEGAAAATALPGLISDLITATEAQDIGAITEATTALMDAAATIVTRLETIATELENLAGTLPNVDPAELAAFAGELADRLFEYLIVVHMEGHYPVFLQLLVLFGAVEREPVDGDPADPTKPAYVRRRLHLDRLDNLLQPGDAFHSIYQWGEAGFNANLLISRLRDLLLELSIPVYVDQPSGPGTPSQLQLFWLTLQPNNVTTAPGLKLDLNASLPGNLRFSFPFFIDGWAIEIASEVFAAAGTEIVMTPPADLEFIPPSGSARGEVSVSLVGSPPDPEQVFRLIEVTGVGRLEATGISARFFTRFDGDSASGRAHSALAFEVEINRGRIIIAPGDTDGFLSQLLPDAGIESDFELLIGVASDTGFYFEGSGTLEVSLPIHISLGPIELTGVTLQIPIGSGGLPIELGASIKAELGPLVAVVEGIGLSANLTFPGGTAGNLGPVNLDPGFKWPTGVGLSIDAQGIKGGGFLEIDRPNHRYAGILQLEFQDTISLTAIGLIITKLPDGKEGFSLLILISAEFQPIQLGMGFTLNGVGGLMGLNRTMVIAVLREGVRNNSLNSILFPEDPVANANLIISDLRAAFPPHEGQFVIGPMALIGYGTPTLISLELGLVIELPSPVRIAILGVLKAVLPEEKTMLIKFQVNFLGTIDFEKGQLTFDASLFDSRLLTFDLSGDMAVRVRWKGEPMFLLSVGGFHPSFQPPPLSLPALRRLTLQLLKGNNPRLRLEMYLAVTSNTVQFGARLELYAGAGKFNVYGFLAFDTLFQFSPFYFIAGIGAMLALRVGSSSIASISLALTLEGTTPWKAKGTAKLKLFWFLTIKVRFSKTWGETRDTLLEDVPVLPLVKAALEDKGNWKSELPSQRSLLVSLKEIAPIGDEVVVHPFGGLTVSQKVVPLNLPIDKFGNRKPSDFNEFSISSVQAGGAQLAGEDIGTAKDHFAPAQFFKKSDAEKLSADSFVKYDSGFSLGTSEQLETSHYVKREVEYELSYRDSQRGVPFPVFAGSFQPHAVAFNAWAKNGAVARSPLSFANTAKSALAPEAIEVDQEQYAVAHLSDLTLASADAVVASEAEAYALMNRLVSKQPDLVGKLHVVPSYELNEPVAA